MSQCFNPNCLAKNSLQNKFCSSCGSKLLLGDRYRAIKYIGEGGFGRTFKAIDEQRLNTTCVIKQFLPSQQGGSAYQKSIELFKQEANCLKDLGKHPQIPELLAFLEQDNRLYLVQEFIEGNNLLQELQKNGKFKEKEVEKVLKELLEILQFIHEHKVIHRDIKPENILRRNSDHKLILIDFGIARDISNSPATKGTTIGSFGYVSWEQMNEGKAYYSSDLYSLAVTCFHLLTGKSPWELYQQKGYSWLENWQDYLTITLSPNLRQILTNLLQIDYKKRYKSAQEVLKVLDSTVISPTTVNQTTKTVKQIPPFKPKVKILNNTIELKAEKIGQFLTGEIKINNYTESNTISGEWQIKKHPNDPPYTKDNHPWIFFKQNKFFSHQPESISSLITIDTSKLQSGKLYERKLSLLINPGGMEHKVKLKIKTAPIPLKFPQFPYALWLSFIFSLIILFYLLLNYQANLSNLLQTVDFDRLNIILNQGKDKIFLTQTIINIVILIVNIIYGFLLGIGYWRRRLNNEIQKINNYFGKSITYLSWLVVIESLSIFGLFLFLEYQTNNNYFDNILPYLLQVISLAMLTFILFNLLGLLIGFIIYLYRQIIAVGYQSLSAIAFLLFTTSIAAIISLVFYVGNLSYFLLPLETNFVILSSFFIYKLLNNYQKIRKFRQTESYLIKP
jgi:serine/threonine protein kinase